MSSPMDGGGPGPLGTVSVVCGAISLIGTVGCCIPIVNYIAALFYPITFILMIVGLVTGFMARSQSGGSDPMATAGLGTSAASLLLFLFLMAIQVLALGGIAVLGILDSL